MTASSPGEVLTERAKQDAAGGNGDETPLGPAAGPAWRISPVLRQQLMEALEQPPKMTYEEFLAWADEDTLAEWVDGEVIMTSPASNRHQDLVGFLGSVLRLFVEAHQLGIVRDAPFQMKLEHGHEPDLLFLAQEHIGRLRRNYLEGPADLVIEIISPESAGRDHGEKFYEYAQGGVAEYWLIDPEACWAEFYRLDGRRYRLAFEGGEGEYRSQVLPGFFLQVEWLWQEPLPKVLDILRQLAVI